jgi:cobalt/nickel transport system permease protein
MHIADGILSAPVLVGGAAVSAAGVAVGLKKMDTEKVPRAAMLTAAFFVSSLIHVPLGPSSVHLLLLGLLGIILGWSVFPAVLVGLIFQSVLFQHGGLTALGVNTANMALPALIVFLLFGRLAGREGSVIPLAAAALAGAAAVILSSLFTAFSLYLAGEEFTTAARLVVIAHLPVAGIEGAVTCFVVLLLKKVKPDILESSLGFSRAAPADA